MTWGMGHNTLLYAGRDAGAPSAVICDGLGHLGGSRTAPTWVLRNQTARALYPRPFAPPRNEIVRNIRGKIKNRRRNKFIRVYVFYTLQGVVNRCILSLPYKKNSDA